MMPSFECSAPQTKISERSVRTFRAAPAATHFNYVQLDTECHFFFFVSQGILLQAPSPLFALKWVLTQLVSVRASLCLIQVTSTYKMDSFPSIFVHFKGSVPASHSITRMNESLVLVVASCVLFQITSTHKYNSATIIYSGAI